jgi:hypothetical protein
VRLTQAEPITLREQSDQVAEFPAEYALIVRKPGAGSLARISPRFAWLERTGLTLVFHEAWLLSGVPKRKNAPELG